jgi:hypothetical protein
MRKLKKTKPALTRGSYKITVEQSGLPPYERIFDNTLERDNFIRAEKQSLIKVSKNITGPFSASISEGEVTHYEINRIK